MTTTTKPVHVGPRSRTRKTLLGLVAGLLMVTVIVFVTTLLAFTRVHGIADTVRTRAAPAVLQLTVARAALVQADAAAIRSFQIGEVQLAGPGEEFQNQIAIASQSLTQVAEDNMAGEAGSRTLQLVEGLLVTYTGLIGQADAHFRQSNGTTLGTADLWSASRLLHARQGGLLAQLDALLDAQKSALDDQLSDSSMSLGTILIVFAPIVGLLVLLVVAHIVLLHRFRRQWNLGLLLAAALLAVLTAVSSLAIVSQSRLEDSRSMLYRLVTDWRAHTSATDAQGQKTLGELVRTACGNSSDCGDTVTRFVADAEPVDSTEDGVNDSGLTDETRKVNEQTDAASANADLEPLIYVLAVLLAAAVLFGFRPRLNEYRYRTR